MTSSTTAPDRVTLRDPGDLIAGIPHLLGFRPSDSVVLIGHRGASGKRLGAMARADTPREGEERELARQFVPALIADGSVGSTLVLVGAGEDSEFGVAHRSLATAFAEELTVAGMRLEHALWVPSIVAGARWRCFTETACVGTLPDPGSSVLAAISTTAGAVTFDSREELAGLLAPDDPAAVRRRCALLDGAADEDRGEPEPMDESGRRSDEATRAGCAVVRSALNRAEQGRLDFTDAEIVELARAISRPRVRDACLWLASKQGHAAVAERLWLQLVRMTPAPERAQTACLLGYFAYIRGDGALAGMAFDNALAADPGDVLAGLLSRTIKYGIPPGRIRQLSVNDDPATTWLGWPVAESATNDGRCGPG